MIHLFLWSVAFSIAVTLGWLASAWAKPVSGVSARHRMAVAVLLLSLAISFIPFVFPHSAPLSEEFNIISEPRPSDGHYYLPVFLQPATGSGRTVLSAISLIYVIGVACILLYSLSGIGFMLWLRVRSERKVVAGDSEVWVHGYRSFAPCCFGRWIFIPEADYTAEEIRMIYTHEQAHNARYHWLEALMFQLVLSFDWYNPAAWRLSSDLRNLHEFEADNDVLSAGADSRTYQMMLIKMAAGARFHSFVNSLNHSSLKKRITMMQKSNQSAGGAWMRSLALVPAFFLALIAVQSPLFATVRSSGDTAGLTDGKVTEKTLSPESKGRVYDTCEVMPEYSGGIGEMYKFLADNMKYPEAAEKKKIQGRVYIKFLVNTDGSLSDFSVAKGVSPELDAEALRVMKLLPNFIPGKVDGKPVNVYFTLPILFRLSESSASATK